MKNNLDCSTLSQMFLCTPSKEFPFQLLAPKVPTSIRHTEGPEAKQRRLQKALSAKLFCQEFHVEHLSNILRYRQSPEIEEQVKKQLGYWDGAMFHKHGYVSRYLLISWQPRRHLG